MAYNAAIDSVYNHYLTTYAPKSSVTGKYDTHKKSELRGIYNSMLKLNKDTPLYILDTSEESREFAVGLKEDARSLRNTIASLGGLDDANMLNKKTAYSTDDGMVSAEYIKDSEEGGVPETFTIEVTGLAGPQENLGYALRSNEPIGLEEGTYSFDLSINDMSYEFQFNIRPGDTNRDVQDRLSRLVTNANVGVTADVLEDGRGSSALRLTSDEVGIKGNKESIFVVSDDNSSKNKGAVDYLGIDYVSKEASNAEFLLNGEPRTASSNHFTIDKTFELTLKGVHAYEGQTSEIGVKTDIESISENVGKLIEGYNDFVHTANEYQSLHPKGNKLITEMERLISFYKGGLNNLGMQVDEQGMLEMDEEAFRASLAHDEDYSQLKVVKDFASSVLRKANQISLNPLEYVDKTVVAYKNPGHNFTSPYVSSNYSGMLFNGYC